MYVKIIEGTTAKKKKKTMEICCLKLIPKGIRIENGTGVVTNAIIKAMFSWNVMIHSTWDGRENFKATNPFR